MVPLSCLKNPRPTRIFSCAHADHHRDPGSSRADLDRRLYLCPYRVDRDRYLYRGVPCRGLSSGCGSGFGFSALETRRVRVTWVTPPSLREREALPLSQPYPLFRSQPHGVRGGERVLLVYRCSGHGDNRCPPPVVPLLCHVFMSCLVFALHFSFDVRMYVTLTLGCSGALLVFILSLKI